MAVLSRQVDTAGIVGLAGLAIYSTQVTWKEIKANFAKRRITRIIT
jgi:hypothetical protein